MVSLTLLEPVDYLVIGHIAQDLTPQGARLGGTAAYAALTARALGLRVGIVTSAGAETSLSALEGIPTVVIPSEHSTTFENMYEAEGRKQILHHRASPIDLSHAPAHWRRTNIVHLGPIINEVASTLPKGFAPELPGLTPQGFLRGWDESGRIHAVSWEDLPALEAAGAVVLSMEDVGGDMERIERMAQHTRVLVVTEGAAGCVVYWHGDRRRFHAHDFKEVDATGAGDIFAAAFFIRLFTTRDPWESARFATLLASYSVTRVGLDGIPTRQEIESCLVEVLQ
ncbi:MAG: Sulfofructose kinase [Anaerolineales bacterium]|nr:Sulfofructose kinase [Anaerolineales bacterium]